MVIIVINVNYVNRICVNWMLKNMYMYLNIKKLFDEVV